MAGFLLYFFRMTSVKAEPAAAGQAEKEAELIGHASVAAFLDKAWHGGRLAHAYLFVGPEHVGKMTAARHLARLVLGGGTPLARHPDLLVVERGRDAKTGKFHADIVLDQVHALRGWLARGALLGGWKVAVIDGAQYLNKEAANALLKSLEEPQPRTLIILLTDAADRIYPTIRSRCQTVVLGRVRRAEIAAALARTGLDQARAELFARLAEGCPGRALGLAQDPAAFADLDAKRRLLLDLTEAPLADRWLLLDKAVPAKLSFNEAAEQARLTVDLLAGLLRDALLAAYGRPESLVNADLAPRLVAWAGKLGPARIAAALEEAAAAKRRLEENVSPRAALENLALVFK